MNWLAHILLSENNIQFQLGNYLADPLKGRVWPNATQDLIKGMSVHKIIDTYTDKHPIFIKSKNRLKKHALLRGIIIDITYDYLLTKNWDKFCNISKIDFTNEFNEKAKKQNDLLSLQANTSLNRFLKADMLNRYQNLEDLSLAFSKLDERLSPRLLKRDTASSYNELIKNNINDLEKDFLIFFPELCYETRKYLNKNKIHHLKV